MRYSAEDFFSVASFRFIIRNLGINAAFALDRILVQQIVRLLIAIFGAYERLETQIVAWDAKWRENEADWTAAGDHPQMQAAAEDLVRLGVVVAIRNLLREAAAHVVDRCIPGLASIVRAGLLRVADTQGQKEILIEEMLLSKKAYRMIEIGLQTKTIKQVTDTSRLFFYFGLLLLHSGWTNVRYYMDHECIDKNIHLVPVAMDCIMALLKFFAIAVDEQTIARALQRHFAVLHRAVELRRKEPAKYSRAGVNAFIILADLYPRKLTCVEYGRIGATFQTSVVHEAYKEVQEAREAREIAQNRLKKDRKGKTPKIATAPLSPAPAGEEAPGPPPEPPDKKDPEAAGALESPPAPPPSGPVEEEEEPE
jgi:hypothetical protein